MESSAGEQSAEKLDWFPTARSAADSRGRCDLRQDIIPCIYIHLYRNICCYSLSSSFCFYHWFPYSISLSHSHRAFLIDYIAGRDPFALHGTPRGGGGLARSDPLQTHPNLLFFIHSMKKNKKKEIKKWFKSHHIDSRHMCASTYFKSVIGRWEEADLLLAQRFELRCFYNWW